MQLCGDLHSVRPRSDWPTNEGAQRVFHVIELLKYFLWVTATDK
jgi:hypothetical protein